MDESVTERKEGFLWRRTAAAAVGLPDRPQDDVNLDTENKVGTPHPMPSVFH
jgi:hypothetical protein